VGEQRVRIVAGRWKGRIIAAPPGEGTRPTSDRVREALFSSLAARMGADLGAGPVLDLFAGSGALAFEALSRGAVRAVLVEKSRAALRSIADNTATLGAAEMVSVVAGDVFGAGLRRVGRLGPFALLLCDPPYRIDPARIAHTVETLAEGGGFLPGAALVWEHSSARAVPEPTGFARERTYRYGDTAVTLMRFYGEGKAAR